MKYIPFILLILISGCIPEITCEEPYTIVDSECCLDENKDNICDEEKSFLDILKETKETKPEAEEVKEKAIEPEELAEYKLFIGNSVDFYGIKIKIEDINRNGEVTLIVNNKKWVIFETNHADILSGLDIKVINVHYDLDPAKSYAILDVKIHEIKEGEHLLMADEKIVIDSISIKLDSVETDDSINVFISDVGLKRIRLGESLVVNGLIIENVKSFHRPIRVENYVILKITKV